MSHSYLAKKLLGTLLKPVYYGKKITGISHCKTICDITVPFILEISLLVEEKIPHLQPLKIRVATVGESDCVTTLTTSCKGEKMRNSELISVIRETINAGQNCAAVSGKLTL